MQHKQLEQLLVPHIKTAKMLEPFTAPTAHKASIESKFGGIPYAQPQDHWPRCPTCQNELSFVVQFMDNASNSLYVFYYCFECSPWGMADEEMGQWLVQRYHEPSMQDYQQIIPLHKNEFTVEPCLVANKHVKVLPDLDSLEYYRLSHIEGLCHEIDSDDCWDIYTEACTQLGCIDDYATLIGGYPRWIQGDAFIHHCPQCGEPLQFLAQIDSEEAANIMWGDVGLVYLFHCPQHPDQYALELQCH
ncbi:DUF1963 domain-containing protein [Candidatus Albibeggiatoa sp. nov. NOAA]|uniref:DUF1963 domain-containing protein n=1 Tax=Candidatus Albibeggiatoa sp. nov. NOAA TaxID=3162724 RepID=UPI003303C550|nr:YwqG family protein [Thiotrichaceae bacterium]